MKSAISRLLGLILLFLLVAMNGVAFADVDAKETKLFTISAKYKVVTWCLDDDENLYVYDRFTKSVYIFKHGEKQETKIAISTTSGLHRLFVDENKNIALISSLNTLLIYNVDGDELLRGKAKFPDKYGFDRGVLYERFSGEVVYDMGLNGGDEKTLLGKVGIQFTAGYVDKQNGRYFEQAINRVDNVEHRSPTQIGDYDFCRFIDQDYEGQIYLMYCTRYKKWENGELVWDKDKANYFNTEYLVVSFTPEMRVRWKTTGNNVFINCRIGRAYVARETKKGIVVYRCEENAE